MERWSRRRPAPQWPEQNRLSSIVSATPLRPLTVGCSVFFGVMRVRIPSKHDGPSGHMRKNWVPEWEQSVADGMNRPQDKHPCLAWPIRRSSCRNGSAVVAQLAEQRPRNAQVTGPNPVDGSFSTKNRPVFPPLSGWFFGNPATGQAWRIPVPLP